LKKVIHRLSTGADRGSSISLILYHGYMWLSRENLSGATFIFRNQNLF